MDSESEGTWRKLVRKEIESIKPYLIEKYAWEITCHEAENEVLLYVRMFHRQNPENVKVLRLAYGPNFPNERPHENFVHPDDFSDSGIRYWINDGQQAFKTDRVPPVICLQGTWGFHHDLHKEKDPLQANLNRLLRDVQICLNKAN
jgi:hypothetical protein